MQKQQNKQAENTQRAAAGMAKATAGRSRVFKDKSKYNRKNNAQAKAWA